MRGKLGEPAYLEDWITTIAPLTAGETSFKVTFDWDEEEMGIPGAFFIRNDHHSEFYLKSLTLEHVPGHGRIYFLCNSWVYPSRMYKKDRIFFTNQVSFSFFLCQSPINQVIDKEYAKLSYTSMFTVKIL